MFTVIRVCRTHMQTRTPSRQECQPRAPWSGGLSHALPTGVSSERARRAAGPVRSTVQHPNIRCRQHLSRARLCIAVFMRCGIPVFWGFLDPRKRGLDTMLKSMGRLLLTGMFVLIAYAIQSVLVFLGLAIGPLFTASLFTPTPAGK